MVPKRYVRGFGVAGSRISSSCGFAVLHITVWASSEQVLSHVGQGYNKNLSFRTNPTLHD